MQKGEGDARGAREGDDLLAERADPGDAELRGRAALLGGHGDERVDEELVVLHVLVGMGVRRVSRSGSLAEGEGSTRTSSWKRANLANPLLSVGGMAP